MYHHQAIFDVSESATESEPIDLEHAIIHAVHMPADWDAANITFLAAGPSGSSHDDTWYAVHDSAGTEVALTVAADRHVVLTQAHLVALAGLRFVKLRSGTVSVPVNQTADRSITLLTRPE